MEERVLLSGGLKARPALPMAAAEVAATGVDPSANGAYLAYLEHAFMTGALAPGREAALLRRLDAGVPRSRVVSLLIRTPEFARGLAANAYQSMLNRPPTAAETRRVAAVIRSGGDAWSVFLGLASGREYARVRGGGTTPGFVRALYRDILDRSPDDGELQAWVARLDAGASRRAVARAILLGPESVARKVAGITLGTPDAGSAAAMARDARILRTPGGLNRLRASLLGAPSVFERVSRPDTTTPPATDSVPLIHPPGLPMSPGLDLGTRWTPLDTTEGPTLDGTNLVAAASDGSIWVTGPTGHRDQLYVLTPADFSGGTGSPVATWRTLPTLPYTVQSLAAVSNDLLYAVAESSEQTPDFGGLFRVDGQGNVTVESTPSGLVTVSAAPDGTVMAVTTPSDGPSAILREPGQSGWTTLPPSPRDPSILKPRLVSTGSQGDIYAVFSLYEFGGYDDSINLVYQYVGGQWQILTDIGLEPRWISATPDGALWAWDFHHAAVRSPITGAFQVVDATIVGIQDGVIQTTPVDAPEAIGVGAAMSRNRLVVSLSPNAAGANTVQVLSLGVADQQAVPMVPTDPLQMEFYDSISTYLGTTGPGGIRAVYDTTDPTNLGEYYSKLLTMPRPSYVDSTNLQAWTAFQGQIEDELQYVPKIQALFASLNLINADIESNNATNLPSIVALIDAGENIPGTSSLTLYLENLFEAVAWGVAAALPGPGAVIGSILASAFGSAVSLAANDPTPNSGTSLAIQYSALTGTLDGLYQSIDTINLAYETSILDDWSRITNLGALLMGPDSAWNPPIGSEATVADAAEPAYNLFFYQSLMPAKWQVVSIPTYTPSWSQMCYICTPATPPYPPAYDLIAKQIGEVPNTPCHIMSYQFLNQVGSNPDPFSSRSGPFPTQALLQAIYDLGITQQTLFSGGGGFNFKIVAGPSGP